MIITIVFGFTMILFGSSGWATSVQGDLKGTWSTKVCRGVFRGEQCWDECTLKIGADGVIKKGEDYTNCLGLPSRVTGGQLTISEGGQIEGTIDLLLQTLCIDRGGIVGDELVLGATSPERWERIERLKEILRFWREFLTGAQE